MADIHLYDVIVRPVVTEKTNVMADDLRQYTFEVDMRANKIQVKEAVEVIFDVTVNTVATMIMPAKMGQRGRQRYQRKKAWKKAVVTLAPGQSIDLFNL
jgi:large subunit ribosomal protein L23